MKRFTASRLFVMACAVATTSLILLEVAVAQQSDIAQRRLRPGSGWQQRGEIGTGYRPRSAATYQQAARTHAQALDAYGRTSQQLPKATVQEHLSEIQRNLDASRKELDKLGDDLANHPELKPHLDAIRKHHEAAAKMCEQIGAAASGDTVDTAAVCECCVSIESELKAAEKEHNALLKKLGIELAPPKAKPAKE